jgi:hypothetical protein
MSLIFNDFPGMSQVLRGEGKCRMSEATLLYTQQYIKNGGRRRLRDSGEQPWWTHLPDEWREQVVKPLAFDVFREQELEAARVFGYDPDGLPCYYAHRYRLHGPRKDRAGASGNASSYAEAVVAWLLRDERWLIHRTVRVGENSAAQSFYSFSETMPR